MSYAIMVDSRPTTGEATATELMLYGPRPTTRFIPLSKAEYEYWMLHLLPRHCSMLGPYREES